MGDDVVKNASCGKDTALCKSVISEGKGKYKLADQF